MPGGRPLKFQTVEELESAIKSYFEECDSRTKPYFVKTKEGGHWDEQPHPKPYTVEGLASHLGVCRFTLINYQDRPEFFDTIKNAKEKILANLIERGLDGDNNPAMAIFNLKNNYDYSDKKESQSNELKITLVDETEGDWDEDEDE